MSDSDPFSLLGLPPHFALTDDEVRQRQRAALASSHPDRFADPVRRAAAMRTSAAISAAARVLLDPATRAEALLGMAGHSAAIPAPPALLMASLAWREALDEAHASGHAEAIAEARQPVEERLAEVLHELAQAIDGTVATTTDRQRAVNNEGHAAPAGATPHATKVPQIAEHQRARELLTELRMLRRLLESPQERRP